jgi:hypothetical protein
MSFTGQFSSLEVSTISVYITRRKQTMADRAKAGSILIRDGTILPPRLSVTTDSLLPNWQIVTSHDRSAFVRGIEGCNWYFFYLAGGTRTTVLGGNTFTILRKAVRRILTKRGDDKLNSLEITATATRHFLGIPFTTFTAHSRHIQEHVGLVPESTLVFSPLAIPVAEPAAKQQPALASRS